PVFRAASRQARIELTVHNPDHALKPGMFIRAAIVLATEAEATIVPQAALTRRDGRDGVFVIGDDGRTAHWRPVTIGIRDGERVQVLSDDLQTFRGHVVTLGQQLLSDGAAVTVPDAPEPDAPAAARFDGDADPGLRGRSAVGVPG